MSLQTTYQIKGMTCGHCVNAVSAELSALPGVNDVQVNLEAGTAVVTSISVLPIDEVRQAVDEAGYALVGVDG